MFEKITIFVFVVMGGLTLWLMIRGAQLNAEIEALIRQTAGEVANDRPELSKAYNDAMRND